MLPIFLSWVVSPIMCAIITVILFFFIRMFILRSERGFMRAFYVSLCGRTRKQVQSRIEQAQQHADIRVPCPVMPARLLVA